MCAHTGIDPLAVIHHVIPRLWPRHSRALRRALTLQAAAQPRCARLVSPRPLAPHAPRHPRRSQPAAGGLPGILRAPGTRMEPASAGVATPPRPLHRLPHPWRLHMLPHGPPHLAGIHVQTPCRLPPACFGPALGESATSCPSGRRPPPSEAPAAWAPRGHQDAERSGGDADGSGPPPFPPLGASHAAPGSAHPPTPSSFRR